MTAQTLKISVIVASTRDNRFGDTVAKWFLSEARAQQDDLTFEILDLREFDLPDVGRAQDQTDRERLRAELASADGFVVVVPEYNHGYPPPLKLAIDLSGDEWAAKPVAFVSYGGMSGGIRAVEQLRQVFAEMHAVTVRTGVTLHRVKTQFDEHGQPVDTYASDLAKRMLDQLSWWARVLSVARSEDPYPG